MGILTNYSPDFVDVIFDGLTITGFADGTFIEIEREVDTFTKKVGSLGDVARTKSLNRSGKITITVMDTHPVNDSLATKISNDEQTAQAFGAFSMKDRSSNTEVRATEAWCMRVPKVTRAQATGNVVYVFEAASIFIKHGGSVI
jgi:hypothetical protein